MDNNLNFERILMNAIDKCNGKIVLDIAKNFQLLYPFTTENIAGYINNFNLSNKTLLTVGSSGDQIINGSLFDCRDIVFLDICPYAKFYTYLKISCLLELERSEFLKFLCYKDYPETFKDNNQAFNNGVYNEIKSTLRLLDYESYLFWDELFSTFKGLDIRTKLFYFDENKVSVVVECNPYLQNDIAYDEARKKIMKTKLEFITGDIFKTKIDRNFDSIWLSNIGTHISRHSLKILVDRVSQNLDDDGILLISYLYDTIRSTKYKQSWWPIYNLHQTFEILKEYTPSMISFIGVDGIKFNNSNMKDSILVYKKSNHSIKI